MAAGGWFRRALNNSTARPVGLFALSLAGAWWWLGGGERATTSDVRSTAATRAEVKLDDLPRRPAAPAHPAPPAAPLPDPEPRRPDVAQPVVARPSQPLGPPPSLVSGKGQVRTVPPPASTLRPAAYAPPPSASNDGFDGRGGVAYKAPTIPGWEAIAVGDLDRVLKPGTDVPCTLNHAIDGTHPGDFSCIVARDIYGWAWPPKFALIPAGTTVRGTYRPLSVGEGRLLGMSAFADVSYGDTALMVPLGGAPVEDGLGRTGMDGYSESRFWERLGNAVITDGASQVARLPADVLQSTGAGVQVSTNTAERIVQDTLRAQGNTVRPLFRKNQGDTINIRITAPVHFGALRYQAVAR